MNVGFFQSVMAALAAQMGADSSPHKKTRPPVLYTAPRFSAFRGTFRPPVGWRKAQSLRRHKKIAARQRRNVRRAFNASNA